MYINLLLVLIFVGSFAFLLKSGLWTNTLTLVNVLTAGLVATNYFEPLASWLDGQESRLTYAYDFLCLWLIFAVVVSLLRVATDYVSPVKVKFHGLVEKIGGPIMAVWVSWVMLCFATMTLHTAPLARNFLMDSFQPRPETKMLYRLAPDRKWLAWVHRESQGSLSRLGGLNPFDPRGDFILRYGTRRQNFEGQMTFTTSKDAKLEQLLGK
ncbi:MAG: CvpA family protein [Pirellulales bacterium]